jgi:hypothetical protein
MLEAKKKNYENVRLDGWSHSVLTSSHKCNESRHSGPLLCNVFMTCMNCTQEVQVPISAWEASKTD